LINPVIRQNHDNEAGIGIWFKRIEGRDMEFIGGFVRDYSL